MPSARVTQQDVAKAAGVHRTTVCLALRKHPGIPAETRDRIAAIADRLGYAPDPMLSALASYRARLRPQAFHGTLAWLINSADGYRWDEFPHYRDYHRGAVSRARHHGFNLEVLDLGAPRMSAPRVGSILRARNIHGVLLCPQPQAATVVELPWEHISAVTFGYTLAEPRMHTVTATHHRNTVRCIRELRRRGYERIGFAFSTIHDRRTDQNFLAGYLAEVVGYGGAPLAPPLFTDSYRRTSDKIAAWIRRHRPDAIVTGEYEALERLRAFAHLIPDRLGLVCPTLPQNHVSLSGVFENSVHMGEVAVDSLVSAIQRGERGVPAQAQRILVEGLWNEGVTLRPPTATGKRVN